MASEKFFSPNDQLLGLIVYLILDLLNNNDNSTIVDNDINSIRGKLVFHEKSRNGINRWDQAGLVIDFLVIKCLS